MGLSVSAVETLIFRARRHLADALEHPGQKRTPVARLLDLLGLGWLRNVFLGAGPAAKLAAGAALLALGGGTAAVALTTDAHSRPAPVRAPVSAVDATFAVSTQARHAQPKVVSVHEAARVSATTGAGYQRATPVAPAASVSTPVAGTTTVPAATTVQPVAPTPVAAVPKQAAPKATTTSIASVPTVTTTPSVPPAPTVQTPTVAVPTVSVPTVSVPAVSVPAVSVPAVSPPTVTLPVGGGGVVGG
jgi:hypothetical protein